MKCNFYPKQSFAKAEDKDVGLCDKGRDIWGLRQRSSREEEEMRMKVIHMNCLISSSSVVEG